MNPEFVELAEAIYGALFFAVPHRGMNFPGLTRMAGDGPNRALVESLKLSGDGTL